MAGFPYMYLGTDALVNQIIHTKSSVERNVYQMFHQMLVTMPWTGDLRQFEARWLLEQTRESGISPTYNRTTPGVWAAYGYDTGMAVGTALKQIFAETRSCGTSCGPGSDFFHDRLTQILRNVSVSCLSGLCGLDSMGRRTNGSYMIAQLDVIREGYTKIGRFQSGGQLSLMRAVTWPTGFDRSPVSSQQTKNVMLYLDARLGVIGVSISAVLLFGALFVGIFSCWTSKSELCTVRFFLLQTTTCGCVVAFLGLIVYISSESPLGSIFGLKTACNARWAIFFIASTLVFEPMFLQVYAVYSLNRLYRGAKQPFLDRNDLYKPALLKYLLIALLTDFVWIVFLSIIAPLQRSSRFGGVNTFIPDAYLVRDEWGVCEPNARSIGIGRVAYSFAFCWKIMLLMLGVFFCASVWVENSNEVLHEVSIQYHMRSIVATIFATIIGAPFLFVIREDDSDFVRLNCAVIFVAVIFNGIFVFVNNVSATAATPESQEFASIHTQLTNISPRSPDVETPEVQRAQFTSSMRVAVPVVRGETYSSNTSGTRSDPTTTLSMTDFSNMSGMESPPAQVASPSQVVSSINHTQPLSDDLRPDSSSSLTRAPPTIIRQRPEQIPESTASPALAAANPNKSQSDRQFLADLRLAVPDEATSSQSILEKATETLSRREKLPPIQLTNFNSDLTAVSPTLARAASDDVDDAPSSLPTVSATDVEEKRDASPPRHTVIQLVGGIAEPEQNEENAIERNPNFTPTREMSPSVPDFLRGDGFPSDDDGLSDSGSGWVGLGYTAEPSVVSDMTSVWGAASMSQASGMKRPQFLGPDSAKPRRHGLSVTSNATSVMSTATVISKSQVDHSDPIHTLGEIAELDLPSVTVPNISRQISDEELDELYEAHQRTSKPSSPRNFSNRDLDALNQAISGSSVAASGDEMFAPLVGDSSK